MSNPIENGGETPGFGAGVSDKPHILISVVHESEERARLLGAVTIDKNGLAVCEHAVSGAVTRLAAVRVGDGSEAAHIPLEQNDEGVVFPLPSDKPSKIGFFLDHDGSRQINGVLRIGKYPGTPLATQTRPDGLNEIMYRLGGIKPDELDEQLWADQIGAFDRLGLNPEYTRGIFSKAHQEIASSNRWDQQRLVVVPDRMTDLVEGFDPGVNTTVFQVLGFETTETPKFPDIDLTLRSEAVSFGGSFEATRDTTKGLTTGLGPSFQTEARTSVTRLASLQSAFEVQITPVES